MTRAVGPIQPLFTARTKKKTIPSSVTAPPTHDSAFAPRSADQSSSRRTRGGLGGSVGVWKRGGGGGRGAGADTTGSRGITGGGGVERAAGLGRAI